MSPIPVPQEVLAPSRAAVRTLAHLADAPPLDSAEVALPIGGGADRRSFSIYDPHAAFDLVDELDFLSSRSIDQNVFFTPQFLAPAMPRLDERSIRLLVARDEDDRRSRLRLLMPFSVERAGGTFGPSTIRAWTHPFGPIGTLPVDADDPEGTLSSLLAMLRDSQSPLPGVLVLPDLRIDGRMAKILQRAAARAGLPVVAVNAYRRPALVAEGDPAAFRAANLSPKRRREFRRQRRMLERAGCVSFDVAVEGDEVREALEDFLVLEAAGWKGRTRSAMLLDRYRAAFAREAVNGLAAKRRVRIYTLRVDGAAVASLVVFVANGEAVAWKTAYDEAHAKASPGFQVLVEASEAMIRDPAIHRVDSCAVPDHFLMNEVWRDKIAIATLVVGLRPDLGPATERAARHLRAARARGYRLYRLRDGLDQALGALKRAVTRRPRHPGSHA